MQHPLSEFRTILEDQLTAWNLPAELAAEIEERSTLVVFEKGAIVFLRGGAGGSRLLAPQRLRKALFASRKRRQDANCRRSAR